MLWLLTLRASRLVRSCVLVCVRASSARCPHFATRHMPESRLGFLIFASQRRISTSPPGPVRFENLSIADMVMMAAAMRVSNNARRR